MAKRKIASRPRKPLRMVRRNTKKSGTANPHKKRRRNNSDEESQARDVYEMFHGRESSEVVTVVDEIKHHKWLGGLGKLVELTFKTPLGITETIEFDGQEPILSASPDKRSLYISGGDQYVDVEALGFDGDWIKDQMDLGEIKKIVYETEKEFHEFELIDYYHKAGEETGDRPRLYYDYLNEVLSIVGGCYYIEAAGIGN